MKAGDHILLNQCMQSSQGFIHVRNLLWIGHDCVFERYFNEFKFLKNIRKLRLNCLAQFYVAGFGISFIQQPVKSPHPSRGSLLPHKNLQYAPQFGMNKVDRLSSIFRFHQLRSGCSLVRS